MLCSKAQGDALCVHLWAITPAHTDQPALIELHGAPAVRLSEGFCVWVYFREMLNRYIKSM